MARRIASIATAVTVIGTLFSTRQPDEDTIAALFEFNSKGFPYYRDIHHPARAFFGDVEVTNARQFVSDRLIHSHFIGQTTFETTTHAGDTGRIQRHPLFFGHAHGNRRKFCQKRGATKRTPAYAMPAELFGLITGTNLAHLNAYPYRPSKVSDQATEVDPIRRSKVKNGFLTVEGEIDADQFHRQVNLSNTAAAQGERFLGTLTQRLRSLEVLESCFPQDCLEVMPFLLEIDRMGCEHDGGNFEAILGLSHTFFPTVQCQPIGNILQDLAGGFKAEPHNF